MAKRIIPNGYTLLRANDEIGFEVFGVCGGDDGQTFQAIAYSGRKFKRDWHHKFTSLERMNARISQDERKFLADRAEKLARAVELKNHNVKVGDVFSCSWGWEQTNIDFYQVLGLSGKVMLEVSKIGRVLVEQGDMRGKAVPDVGNLKGEPFKCRVQRGFDDKFAFKVNSFSRAHYLPPLSEDEKGDKVYRPKEFTSYA